MGSTRFDQKRTCQYSGAGVLLAFGILVAGFIIGCSRSREGEFALANQRADPHKMQAWAKDVLEAYPTNTFLFPDFPGIAADRTMIILSNPPAFLNELAILQRMGPMVAVSPAAPASNRFVSLLYADSFGFGGRGHEILIGGESFRQTTNASCIEWIPGVYFCTVKSP